jgi:hypothetical protein
MPIEVASATIGELTAFLVTDGTDFYIVKLDALGRMVVLLGYTGSAYVALATNASGQLIVECVGSA